jgi:alcohol dehydrogenase
VKAVQLIAPQTLSFVQAPEPAARPNEAIVRMEYLAAAEEDVLTRVKDVTGGALVDVAIEACGLRETYRQVFEVVRKQGTVVIFGVTHLEDTFPFDWGSVYAKLPNIIVTNSSQAGERTRLVAACVDLVAQGRLDLSYLLTHRFAWSAIPEALDTYSTRKDRALKCIIAVTQLRSLDS